MELEGRTVLITGGARRIGRAIALRLARERCSIALHFHTSASDAQSTAAECVIAGARAESFCADLVDPLAPSKLVAEVQARFGRLDVLINNASIYEPDELGTITRDRWQRTLDLNLTAPLLLAQAAAPLLRQARGRIVNLCDAAAGRPRPNFLSYSVSKAALESLTRALARELAPQVGVVGVAPGIADWPESIAQDERARLTARIPLRRAGNPEDVAALVRFLLCEGDYLTGTIIPVDGGRSIV